MFIEDCIAGTRKIFESNCRDVLNIGSEEQVSINQMISIIEEFAEQTFKKNYLLDKPKGVRGRSSDNDLVRKKIKCDTKFSLKDGLRLTYDWIYKQIISNANNNKFTRNY